MALQFIVVQQDNQAQTTVAVAAEVLGITVHQLVAVVLVL
jgi:hypothetical protein